MSWTFNYSSEPAAAVDAAAGAVTFAAGATHSLALKADGTVVTWMQPGYSNLGSATVPDGLPDVIALAAGRDFSLVLRDASADAPPVLSVLGDQTVVEDQSATWTVTASGAGPFTYQWRKNGENIAGATTATLTLPRVLPADTGSYDVVVTNYFGSTTSNSGVLTILPLPAVTAISPSRQVLEPGQALNLGVSATGTGALSYRWYHNGQVISHDNTNSYIVDHLTLEDSGWYVVEVTDTIGTRRNKPFFVTVAPTVTKLHGWGPAYSNIVSALPTLNDIIAVSTSGDYDAYALALRRDGTVVAWGSYAGSMAAIPDGVSDIVAVCARGSQPCALRSDGTVVSWGTLPPHSTDIPAGLNDVVALTGDGSVTLALRADGTVVSWGDQSDQGLLGIPSGLDSVTTLAVGSGFALALKTDGTVVGWGTTSPYVQAQQIPSDLRDIKAIAAALGGMALKPDGTIAIWGFSDWGRRDFPPLHGLPVSIAAITRSALFVHNGGEVGAVISSDLSGMNIQLSAVHNLYGLTTAASTVLALSGEGGPVVTCNPVSVTRNEQQQVIFSVGATGLEPLSFQWRRNGTAIPGATSPDYFIEEVAPADAGDYDVVITNSLGSATSRVAQVTVNQVPVVTSQSPLRNYGFLGEDFTFGVAATGTGALSYQWVRNGLPIAGATAANLPLTGLTTADGGWYLVNVTDDVGTRRSQAMFLNVAPHYTGIRAWGSAYYGATEVPSVLNDIVGISAGTDFGLALRRNGTVVAWGANGSSAINPPPDLSDVVAVAAGYTDLLALKGDGTVVGWNTADESYLDVPAGLHDVVAIATEGNHSLALRSNGKVVAWGDDGYHESAVPDGLSNIVAIAAGHTYSLALDATGQLFAWGTPVSIGLGLVPLAKAVASGDSSILVQRLDGTLASVGVDYGSGMVVPASIGPVKAFDVGYGHTLAIKNDGTVAAWFTDGTFGSAAEGASTIPADLGDVFAISAGWNFSIALSEVFPPALVSQPVSCSVAVGGVITLGVTATGSGDLFYQWRKNGSDVPGETLATLTIGPANPADAGSYDVVVTNYLGSVVSTGATVAVLSGFDAWSNSRFSAGELLDPNISGPNAVYGQDGLPNLVKYALGLDPKQNITTGLPAVSTTATDWVYTYTRPTNITDVTYEVEVSSDLVSWSSAGVIHELVSSDGTTDTWHGRFPLASASTAFFHLKVTR